MTPELGLAALWLAAAFAALQLACGFTPRVADLAAPAAWAGALLTVLAFAALLLSFYTIDLSVEAVIAVADAGLPVRSRLMAIWATPAGAALLGATLVALAGGLVALTGTTTAALARLGGVALLLDVAVLVLAPFARAEPYPIAGNGLAAALQLPWLPLTMPLLAASGAALLTGVVLGGDGRRWRWVAVAVAFAAALVEARGNWLAHGTPLSPMLGAVAATGIVALVMETMVGGWRRAAAAMAGAVLAAVGLLAPVEHETVVVAARVRPAAGAGWAATVAEVRIDGQVFAPEWRTYQPRGDTVALAAVARGRRDNTAVTLTGPPRARRTEVIVTRRPALPLAWLGGVFAVVAALAGMVRR